MESVRRKLVYDLYYLRHQTLGLDIRLIAATGLHLFGMPYAPMLRLLRIPGILAVESVTAAQMQARTNRLPVSSQPDAPAATPGDASPIKALEMVS
jgi:hypothetical protein